MRIALFMSLASAWCRQYALELAALGHEVHVIDMAGEVNVKSYVSCLGDIAAQEIQQVARAVAQIHLLHTGFRTPWCYFATVKQARRICLVERPQIILSMYGSGFALLSYLTGFRPYAAYTVGSDVLKARGVQRMLTRKALQGAAVVFANGGYLAQMTTALAPRARVTPLIIGVDVSRFVPKPTAKGPTHIVCTRGFDKVYNNESIIYALATLPFAPPPVQVTFTSGGPMLKRAIELANCILPTSIREHIAFLGSVSSERLLTVLQTSHVFISMSRSDGTSISLLEALACGLYPVLSDIPQNREWVGPSQHNGALVPLDNAKALGAALLQAVCEPHRREVARPINIQRVTSSGNIHQNARYACKVLERIANSHSVALTCDRGQQR